MKLTDKLKKRKEYQISFEGIGDISKEVRVQDEAALSEYNKNVKRWTRESTSQLKGSVQSMLQNNRFLSSSIVGKVYSSRQYAKEANRIGFSFRREGIYVHKGAGRGQGGWIGSSWIDEHGVKKEASSTSRGKMNTRNRRAKPWYDIVMKRKITQLGDIVTDYSSTLQMDATQLLVNKDD